MSKKEASDDACAANEFEVSYSIGSAFRRRDSFLERARSFFGLLLLALEATLVSHKNSFYLYGDVSKGTVTYYSSSKSTPCNYSVYLLASYPDSAKSYRG
jgi:hypothetical protein